MILALSGISIPYLSNTLASLINCIISTSKFTYNFLFSSCLTIKVAYNAALLLSISFDQF